tara:strand:- start:16400 stop:16915 length:516 start_codon:yes stop_codon:yes gene_type:complete
MELVKNKGGRPPKKVNKGGRPTVMTPEVIGKLEHVFSIGGSDGEACLYASISKQALYDYQTLNPAFTERKEHLKETPFLKARTTIAQSLSSTQGAQWFMERKNKVEFGKAEDTTPATLTKNTYNFIFSPEVREKVKVIDGDIKKLLTQAYVSKTKEDVGIIEERPDIPKGT